MANVVDGAGALGEERQDAAFKRASVRLPEGRGGGGSGLERLLRHVEAVRPWRGIRLREERFELGGKIRKDVGEGKDRLRAITDELLATFGICFTSITIVSGKFLEIECANKILKKLFVCEEICVFPPVNSLFYEIRYQHSHQRKNLIQTNEVFPLV